MSIEKSQIEIVENGEEKILLKISNTDYYSVNELRRKLIALPSLTINRVEVEENTSVLHDDFIIQRVSLLPLKGEKGMCKLNIIATQDRTPVYSKDIVSDSFSCIHDNIVITYLNTGQQVKFIGYSEKVSNGPNVIVVAPYFKKIDNGLFEFSFESSGVYSCEKMLNRALSELKKDFNISGVDDLIKYGIINPEKDSKFVDIYSRVVTNTHEINNLLKECKVEERRVVLFSYVYSLCDEGDASLMEKIMDRED